MVKPRTNKKRKTKNVKMYKGAFQEAKYIDKTKEGAPTWELDVPDIGVEKFPTVSVITITKNRLHMINIMLYNWRHTNYPEDKIEWIIVDDSDTNDLQYYLPLDEDERIHYFYVKEGFSSIAEKRNFACEKAGHELLTFMDDDDYYFPDHVVAKMKVLYHYNKDGVCSTPIAVYDLTQDHSYIYDWHHKGKHESNDISESSVMVRKSYWKQNKFKSASLGEGRGLVNNQFSRWMKLHFLFNTISITHYKNVTGFARMLEDECYKKHKADNVGDFKQVFPPTFMYLLNNLKNIQLQDRKNQEKDEKTN